MMSSQQPILLRSTTPTSSLLPIADRFNAAVHNTGNFFFEEALQGHLEDIQVCRSWSDLPHSVERLVLSFSNFISGHTDLGWIYDQLAERDISNIVMIGAGAQADDYSDEINLKPGTMKFLKLLAERSTTIGVRGDFTAEILNRMGIKNVEVIGCPTAFWAENSPIRKNDRVERLAVHCTPTGHFRDSIGALFAHGVEHGAQYIIQSEVWMMQFLLAEMEDTEANDHARYFCTGAGIAPETLKEWIRSHGKVYFDIREWIDAMRDLDFVYGSRFHGNMAAIQAGTPALNMVFDTRTRELCEYLNLPHIPLEQFHRGVSLSHLMDLADFTLYEATFAKRRQSYCEFLARNGLTMRGSKTSAAHGSRARERSAQRLLADIQTTHLPVGAGSREIALRARLDRPLAERLAVERGEFPVR